jgi:hypothetical protein
VGKRMDEMYLEAPCLQPTCSYCRYYHPQLVHEPPALHRSVDDDRGEGDREGSKYEAAQLGDFVKLDERCE